MWYVGLPSGCGPPLPVQPQCRGYPEGHFGVSSAVHSRPAATGEGSPVDERELCVCVCVCVWI